jgi:hypothetical protein
MRANEFIIEGVAGPKKCWPGHRKVGTQPGTGKNKGKRVNDCEKIGEQGVAEGSDQHPGVPTSRDELYHHHLSAAKISKGRAKEYHLQQAEKYKPKQGAAEGQLNEYLVKAGMPVKDVLALNLFQDFDPVEGAAAQFAEFAEEPMWQQVVRKYAPIANMLKKKLLAQKRPLTDAEAEAVEQTWYDGSDAYDDMEIEYLVDIYDQQIDTLEALLAGNLTDEEFGEGVAEDWNKVNKQDKTDGLSQKAVNAYRRENPGSKLKTAVTTKPSKLKPGSKAAKRRKSFCARMGGNKGPMKDDKGRPTPKAKALRRWNCESIEDMRQLIENAERYITENKHQRMDPSKVSQAVPELHAALLASKTKIHRVKTNKKKVYDIIDGIMQSIALAHDITGQKLHDLWVKKYKEIPDTWIMNK